MALLGAATAHASDPGTGDWPMWGGSPDRNMVSAQKGLPTEWDVKTKKNVKWIATLGSTSYGNPVVAGGMVFVGTNNDGLRDPRQPGDRGVLMAFRASDGEFLWQMTHEKLAAGRVNDWPFQGVASSPLVDGDRVYYVSNRAELVCLDIQGFRDGENDGPFKDERFTSEKDGDVVWKFDMIAEVGTFPHNLANSSPVSFGDLVYVSTSNGHDESHVKVPSPGAPGIVAVDKKTGKLAWQDNSVGDRILHGQWASPTVGRIGGVDQVILGQGDGWIRGYEAATGKKLWEFDTNPRDSVWPKTRNELISTAVVYDGLVYIANGQDPEHGEGVGPPLCDRRDQARRHHADRPRLALRQDPALDLDRRHPGRRRLLPGLQRLSPCPRRQDGAGAVDPRHVRGGVGLAARRRGPGLPGRRGRRRRDAAGGAGEEGARRDRDGQLRLLDAGARRRGAVHLGPKPFVRVGPGEVKARVLLPFIVAATAARGAPGGPSGWPQFRGGPELTGVATGMGLPQRLRVLWTFEAGEAVESSAAIAEGAVFVGTRAGLVALDLATGKPRWTYKAGSLGIGESSPAVAEGTVYVGDLDGTIHAVSAADGQKRWSFKTGNEVKSSPVVAGKRVLVGSYDGNLYALDAATGAVAWKVPTEGPVHGTPAISNGIAYVTGCDQHFRGVRIADGKVLADVGSGAYTGASPALAGGRAFYGTFENEVLAVDLRAARVAWRYRPADRQFPFYSSAAVAGGKVVLGGRDKRVHAIDAASGTAAWTFATQGRVESSPAIAAGRVYVGSNDGRLYVLDLATGRKLTEWHAGAAISASPAIAGGRLVIGAHDGRIYCLG